MFLHLLKKYWTYDCIIIYIIAEKGGITMGENRKTRRKRHKHAKGLAGSTALFLVFVLFIIFYAGMSIYYRDRYYLGTRINGFDCSNKKEEDVKKIMQKAVSDYEVTVNERYYLKETRKGSELGLSFNDDGTMARIMKEQMPLFWISALVKRYDYSDGQIAVSLDEEKFKDTFLHLDAFNDRYLVKTRNAYSHFNDKTNKYDIIKEVVGNKVDKKLFYNYMKGEILKLSPEVDVAASDAYAQPRYYETSDDIVKSNKKLNKYMKTKIVYDFDDRKYVVDADLLHTWLSLDKDYRVHLDEDKVKEFVTKMAEETDTLGGTREFTSIAGNHVKVSGGTYGWQMDQNNEYQHLVNAIKKIKREKREPKYFHIARCRASNDLGDTYVEVDLGSQHCWFYKNGKILVSTDVVTGCVAKGRSTPTGTYYVLYKQTNHTMVGPGYRSFVNYWLPYMDRGIGLHDASWRGSFGGSIYYYNGSHGCVNMPYSAVQTIFHNIDPYYPVCVHY